MDDDRLEDIKLVVAYGLGVADLQRTTPQHDRMRGEVEGGRGIG
jgi:hypothetical protein